MTKIQVLKKCIDRVARVAPLLYFVCQDSRYTRRFVALMKARNRRVRVQTFKRARAYLAHERIRSLGWTES
jgi:hypothetical protein